MTKQKKGAQLSQNTGANAAVMAPTAPEKKEAKVVVVEVDDNELAKRINDVSQYVKNVTPVKAMSLFNRTKNDNVKLDKFLSQSFTQPQAFKSREEAQKAIEALITPKNHEHHGLIAIEQQRALLAVLVEKFLASEVDAKVAWIKTFNLDEEQTTKATAALEAYRTFLIRNARAAAKLWEQVYGFAEAK